MNETSWLGLGMAAITLVGGAVATYQNRRANRDKMEFDSKQVEQSAKIASQEEKIASQEVAIQRCEDDRTDLRNQIKECNDLHRDTQAELRDQSRRIDVLERKL